MFDKGGFLGNKKASATLDFWLQNGKTPHAVMFFGEEGLGKRTLARRFAKALLCVDTGVRPCGKCASCRAFENGVHSDFYVLSVQEGKKIITADEARAARMSLFEKPIVSGGRVLIIENAGMMNASAQNILLKVFEEPNDGAVILLTASSKAELLSTVISRMTVVPVMRLTDDAAETKLISMGFSSGVEDAVSVCSGNLGKCVELLSDDGFLNDLRLASGFFSAYLSSQADLIAYCAKARDEKTKEDPLKPERILKYIGMICGNIIRAKNGLSRPLGQISGFFGDIDISQAILIEANAETALKMLKFNVGAAQALMYMAVKLKKS